VHRVAVLSRAGRDSLADADRVHLSDRAQVRFVRRTAPPAPEQAVRLLRGVDILVATNQCLPVLDDALLAACPRLRHVVLYATGHDHVDQALLARHGVRLRTLPDYATVAVAEHALGLILALSARIPLAHDRSRGAVPPDTSLRGVELADRTLGIIGTGRIGRRLAAITSGIGMSVLGSDVDPVARWAAGSAGLTVVATADLLERSDVVAVCASTQRGTPAIVDAAAVDRMRPGSLLVSIARPCRIDTAAVLTAIRDGRMRGFAVDDVVVDPASNGDLLTEGRVVQTGHSAWWRDEALRRGARMLGQAVHEALDELSSPRSLSLVSMS
jgi:phosphoglycerate dehydrogenase-like enzyme